MKKLLALFLCLATVLSLGACAVAVFHIYAQLANGEKLEAFTTVLKMD